MNINFNYYNKLILLFLFALISCNKNRTNDPSIQRLITKLNSHEWDDVDKSKNSLEQLENQAIPYLIQELNSDNKYIKLVNTGDLIYPGTTEFYGSGRYLPYDLDWKKIRIGWVIEQISFQNFGFGQLFLTNEKLLSKIKDSILFDNYLKTGKLDFTVDKNKELKLQSMVQNVNNWWEENKSDWTRLKGLTEALQSMDDERLDYALSFLRNNENCVNGLTEMYFRDNLKSLIVKLQYSKNSEVSSSASLLMCEVEDKEYNDSSMYINIIQNCWKKNNR